MARIRSIHPSLFTDEDYMSLSPFAMAAWPGIWVEADDNGVFEWKPLTLKARLLPCAAIEMGDILAEYEGRGMVRRFSANGKDYGAIRNFRKFQRPEKPKAWHPLPDNLRLFVALPPTDPQPVADQSPTAPRKSPQMEDVGGRMEVNSSDADASGADAPAVAVFDLRSAAFNDGAKWLSDASKRPIARCKGQIGKWVKQTDEAFVLKAFQACSRAPPAGDVTDYLFATFNAEADRRTNARQPTNQHDRRAEPSGPGAARALLRGLATGADTGNDDGGGQAWDGGTGPVVDATFSRVAGG